MTISWNIEDNPRERERESRITQLKSEIQQLEQITNRTAEQEAELNSKKQELAELEKRQSQAPNKTNWIPWLIGGGVILVLVVGIIAYYWKRNKEK